MSSLSNALIDSETSCRFLGAAGRGHDDGFSPPEVWADAVPAMPSVAEIASSQCRRTSV